MTQRSARRSARRSVRPVRTLQTQPSQTQLPHNTNRTFICFALYLDFR